jgi:hypothetical protein
MRQGTIQSRQLLAIAIAAVGLLAYFGSAAAAAVAKDATKTEVACVPGSLESNQPGTCTVTVTDTSGALPLEQGRVDFTTNPGPGGSGTFGLGTATGTCNLPSGAATVKTCSTTYKPGSAGAEGVHKIRAVYKGDTNHEESNPNGEFSITILRSMVTTVKCEPGSVELNKPSVCTATVVDNTGALTIATGKVEFSHDAVNDPGEFLAPKGNKCDLAAGNGKATCSVSYSPGNAGRSGTHTITAEYQGDATHAKASGSGGLIVIRPISTTVLCAPTPLKKGEEATCTATVKDTSVAPATPTAPTGTVKFGSSAGTNGSFTGIGANCSLTTVPLSTEATCVVHYVPLQVGTGTHVITGVYQGDSTHELKAGAGFSIEIVRESETKLVCTPNPLKVNESSVCTATVDDKTNPPTAPNGEVKFTAGGAGTFLENKTSCTLQLANGIKSCSVTYKPSVLGTQALTAAYQGDATHEKSSIALTLNVVRPTTTAVSCTPANVQVGQQSTCTATVKDESAAAEKTNIGGSVQMSSNSTGVFPNGNTCSNFVVVVLGTSTCSLKYEPTGVGNGEHKIQASYNNPDAGHDKSATGVAGQFAVKIVRQTDNSLSCEKATISVNESMFCTVTVEDNTSAALAIAGEVKFTSSEPVPANGVFSPGSTCNPTGGVTASGGFKATCQLKYEPKKAGTGVHLITAEYKGEAVHIPGSSNFTVTVKRPSKTTLVCSPSSVAVNKTTTCTATAEDTENVASPTGNDILHGEVQFGKTGAGSFSNGAACAVVGAAKVSCSVTFVPTAIGSQNIEARFQADPTHDKSQTAVIPITALRGSETEVVCAPALLQPSQTASCTATVNDTAGAGTPATGQVKFSAVGGGAFTPAGANTCTLSTSPGGKQTCSVSYNPEVVGTGTHTIEAEYQGDVAHGKSPPKTTTLTMIRQTFTSIACTPNSLTVGRTSTCTATIEDRTSGPAPIAGEVVFSTAAGQGNFPGGAACSPSGGVNPAGGTIATCSVTYSPTLIGTGTHTIQASYSEPGGVHDPSQKSVTINVKRQTRTDAACIPATPKAGDTVSCTITVADTTEPGPSTAVGGVELEVSGGVSFPRGPGCGPQETAVGVASCVVTYVPSAGPHTVTAKFTGDGTHEVSVNVSQVVVLRNTNTTVACAPSPLQVANPTTCTVTVEDSSETGATAIDGSVKFSSDGPGAFSGGGACAPSGGTKATCTVTFTPSAPGTQTITAAYQVSPTHEASKGTGQVQATPAPIVTPPPAPAPNTTLLKKPAKKSTKPKAEFTFSSDQAGSSFQCKLDKGAFKACRSPFRAKVKPGRHAFQVRAVNAQGLADASPIHFNWTVAKAKK